MGNNPIYFHMPQPTIVLAHPAQKRILIDFDDHRRRLQTTEWRAMVRQQSETVSQGKSLAAVFRAGSAGYVSARTQRTVDVMIFLLLS